MAPQPIFGKTPLELLAPNTDYEPTFFEKHAAWILGPPMGVAMSAATNLGLKRPILYSSVPRHIGLAIAGYFVFKFYLDYKENYNAERDAVYRHYIQLHPEDFPPPERKQYKDLFSEWIPIR